MSQHDDILAGRKSPLGEAIDAMREKEDKAVLAHIRRSISSEVEVKAEHLTKEAEADKANIAPQVKDLPAQAPASEYGEREGVEKALAPTPEEREAAEARRKVLEEEAERAALDVLKKVRQEIMEQMTGEEFWDFFACAMNEASKRAHTAARMKGFYDKPEDNHPLVKACLVMTEVSEAAEGFRSKKDGVYPESDKIKGFSSPEEEYADAIIRMLDHAGFENLRLGRAIEAKIAYNQSRPYKHGKSC